MNTTWQVSADSIISFMQKFSYITGDIINLIGNALQTDNPVAAR